MYKSIFILLLFFSTTAFSRTIITVTHPVEDYFIKKIANNKVYVRIVHDRHRKFRLDDKKLVDKLSSSKYYFKLNLEEENNIINKFQSINHEMKVVDITKNIGNIKDKNGLRVPYIWMDPLLVRKIAINIYDELVKIRSYDKEYFKKNLELFLYELDEIYLHIKKRIADAELYGFFTFNNYLDYFAKRYRLDIYHKEYRYSKAEEINEIIRFSRKEFIRHIVLKTGGSYLIAQSLSSHISGKIVEVDIYGRNWKSTLYTLVRNLTNY